MGFFGKIKEGQNATVCACNGNAPEMVAESVEGSCCCGGDCCSTGKIESIKVLGSGCKSCHALYENAQEAVKAMGISVEVEYVSDMEKIARYGVMSMPAMVVNEKAVSMGKVLKPADIEKLFHKLGF